MTYQFFASKEDKIQLLEFIFNERGMIAYDLSSEDDKEQVCQYRKAEDITSKFDLENGSPIFKLWTPRFLGDVTFRKIIFDPKRVKYASFCYSTEGWGLIQLYFVGLNDNEMGYSTISHFNEKSALGWGRTSNDEQGVKKWDWKEVNSTSRKIKYRIHNKLSVKVINGYGVMPGAATLEAQGVKLCGMF
ncbi:MAG: hypothetical protein K0Q79_3275 [Flavipsychrobacter sp.]|jgi:hypothetical protein|nr:hypothetical protein [Flavipsychrobacter sp.]